MGEHLRGHPLNTSFASRRLSYGSQLSSLSAIGSVGECLTDSDTCVDGMLMYRDMMYAYEAAFRDGTNTSTPGVTSAGMSVRAWLFLVSHVGLKVY